LEEVGVDVVVSEPVVVVALEERHLLQHIEVREVRLEVAAHPAEPLHHVQHRPATVEYVGQTEHEHAHEARQRADVQEVVEQSDVVEADQTDHEVREGEAVEQVEGVSDGGTDEVGDWDVVLHEGDLRVGVNGVCVDSSAVDQNYELECGGVLDEDGGGFEVLVVVDDIRSEYNLKELILANLNLEYLPCILNKALNIPKVVETDLLSRETKVTLKLNLNIISKLRNKIYINSSN